MPTFEKTIFTNLGISFINDLNSAHNKLTSAKTVYSSSDLSGMSDDDIKNMTDIANKELTVNCDIIKLDEHETKIRSTANNEQLKQGVYIRTYATYVVDQDGNQTLFSIKVNTKPQFLAPYDGVNTNAQSYGFNVAVSQTDNISFTKLSNLAATMQDLEHLKLIGSLTDNDDILKLSESGHYIINGTNPKNNPWGDKPIWADVYRTDYNTLIRDNTGNVFIRSYYDSIWRSLLTNLDADSLSNQSKSLADSVASSLGTWNRSGFDSVGGSVAWLYDQNDKRMADAASNASAIGSVASSLGAWNRSGFDSVGGSVAWLYDQNNKRMADVSSLASTIQYSYIKELGNDDDVLNLPKNGHYVIRGANPSNNPWGKNIWADVYKTDYQTLVRDNTGNEFIRSNNDSIWRSLLTNFDKDYLSNQSQSLANSVASSLGTWNRSGFDSVGGSLAWLYDQNNSRTNDTASLATATSNNFSYTSSTAISLADSLGGYSTWLSSSTNSNDASLASVDASLNAQIVANESYTSSTAISLADSLGGYGTWLSSSTNSNDTSLANNISNNASSIANNSNAIIMLNSNTVKDNKDGSIGFNGNTFSLLSTISPKTDLFHINNPGMYQSLWGYQDTLTNFPGGNGAAIIVAIGQPGYISKLIVINSWGFEYQSLNNNGSYTAWQQPPQQSDINAINTRINADEQSINNNQTNINNMMLLDWEYSSWGLANQNPSNYPDCYYRLSDNTIQLTGSIDVQNGDYLYFLNRFIQANSDGSFSFGSKHIVMTNWSMNSLPFTTPKVYQSNRRNCMAIGVGATQTGKFDLTGCYIQIGFI